MTVEHKFVVVKVGDRFGIKNSATGKVQAKTYKTKTAAEIVCRGKNGLKR